VGLLAVPEGQWYCPQCSKGGQIAGKGKRRNIKAIKSDACLSTMGKLVSDVIL
jgi:hypothetical protein